MADQDLLALFDQEQRKDLIIPGMQKETTPHVVRFVHPAPVRSFILYSRLDDSNAEMVIEEQIDYFTRDRMPFEWKVYEHDSLPDLKERLTAHGFTPDDREAIMVLDLKEAPVTLLGPPRADIRTITQKEELADVTSVEAGVWDMDFAWIRERLGEYMDVPGYIKVYVARVDGQPVCTGWIFFHFDSQFASLWGGSTLPEYRQRGLYTAILAKRVQDAIQRGYRYLTIDASPMSEPIVARHGFQLLTHAWSCEWKYPKEV